MAVELLKNPISLGPEKAGGIQINSFGGAAQVLNTNSASASADPDDIQEILIGATTVKVLPIPAGSYLHLTHHWTDVAAATINQAPIVRVYGRVPNHNAQERLHPQDVDSDFPDLHASGYLLGTARLRADLRGIWVPVTTPGYTLGTPGLTLSQVGTRHLFNADANQYVVSEEQYVFLGGITHAIVVVAEAATYTSGSDPKGVIVGRLTG